MFGAIIGDIIGSVYEFNNIKTKDFPLFRDDCFFTDDTVMTIAVAEGIMNGGSDDDIIDAMKKYGRMYPNAGYGGRFSQWLFSNSREPYNSFGNGSAMRTSPAAWLLNCGFTARTGVWPSSGLETVGRVAAVTHNHPEGIKGAQAVSLAIFIGRLFKEKWVADDWSASPVVGSVDECKEKIRYALEKDFGYDISRSLDEIRPTNAFNETCQKTVPEAMIAFLESNSFEDAIRNAISIGGDSDTIAAITGSIAEPVFGIPQWIKERAWEYLDKPLKSVCNRWREFLKNRL